MDKSEESKNGEVQKQQIVSMAQFDCHNCGKKMMARMPVMRVMNAVDVTVIACTHERPSRCGSCGASFLPLVVDVNDKLQIKLVWRQVQLKESIGPSKQSFADTDLKIGGTKQ